MFDQIQNILSLSSQVEPYLYVTNITIDWDKKVLTRNWKLLLRKFI